MLNHRPLADRLRQKVVATVTLDSISLSEFFVLSALAGNLLLDSELSIGQLRKAGEHRDPCCHLSMKFCEQMFDLQEAIWRPTKGGKVKYVQFTISVSNMFWKMKGQPALNKHTL